MTLAGSSGIRLLRSSPAMDQPAYCSLHSTYSVGARYEGIVFTGNSITCKALPSIKTVESCLLVSFAEEKDHLGGCKSQVSPGYQLRALMHTMDPSSSIAWSVSQNLLNFIHARALQYRFKDLLLSLEFANFVS